ncbi:MAG: zinc ribbon domain-containing protein [Oscillospiraceae bacterium]|nr:zinc ribbon domain-containing protein [Oscillospiraceae bacterium]
MTEVRSGLKKLLENNRVLVSIMPGAFVFLLLYPVLGLIDSFTLLGIGIYDSIQALWYVLYLFGLLLCFAESMDWAIGCGFALNCLRYLVYIIRFVTFNRAVYLVFYGVLAFFFLRSAFSQNRTGDYGARTRPAAGGYGEDFSGGAGEPKSSFCGSCGSALSPGAKFCPVCGRAQVNAGAAGNPRPASGPSWGGTEYAGGRNQAPRQVSRPAPRPSYYSGPAGMVVNLCGSVMALVFTILLTAYLFFSLIQSFTFLNIVTSIPMILVCIGCWIVYVSSARQDTNTTGFSLIGGGILVVEIVVDILISLGIVAGIAVMVAGKSQATTAIGLLLVAGFALALLLVTLYWNGLRKSAVTAKRILRGEAQEWETSMYSVVILCVRAVYMLIVLLAAARIQAAVTSLLSSLLYSGSLYAGGMSSGAASMMESALSALFHIGWAARLTNVLSAVIAVFAVAILISIRRRGREIER